MDSDYLLFIDGDELPSSIHMIEAAAVELEKEDTQCWWKSNNRLW